MRIQSGQELILSIQWDYRLSEKQKSILWHWLRENEILDFDWPT